MIPKYRTQLYLLDEGVPPSIERVRAVVREWLIPKGLRTDDELVESGARILTSSSRVEILHDIIGSEEQWALHYVDKDRQSPLTWVVDLGLAHSDAHTRASIAMGLELTEQRAVPVAYRLRPPALVNTLAARFTASAGKDLRTRARRIDSSDIDEFVAWVVSPQRQLPILAVSVDLWTERTLLDPDTLQQTVLGLAEVIVLTKRACMRLTSRVAELITERFEPQQWSVHSGALRIYWPGLDLSSHQASPFQHKLWVPGDGRLPPGTSSQVYGQLSFAAAHRPYSDWTDPGTIERRAEQEQLERLLTQLSSQEKDTYEKARARYNRDRAELQVQLDDAVTAERDARANGEQAWEQVRKLEVDNADLRRRLNDLQPVDQEKPEPDWILAPHRQGANNERNVVDVICDDYDTTDGHIRRELERLQSDTFWDAKHKSLSRLEGEIWEYRVNTKDHWIRFFVARIPAIRTVVVLNGYAKKQNQLDEGAITTARERWAAMRNA